MADVTFEEVAKLADKLSPEDRQALITHLQERTQHRKLRPEEWNALLNSITISIPPGPKFSDKREDWYDDDGR